jgi:hypothetical protein
LGKPGPLIAHLAPLLGSAAFGAVNSSRGHGDQRRPAFEGGNYVDLRAEHDVLAILSNRAQTHNLCKADDLTPNRAIIGGPA